MKTRAPTKLPVPAFTPVPRRKPRHDGWTAARQIAFLDALAETGSVKHAAERINMAPEGAYALRRQPGAESFRTAWEAALDHGVQRLRDIAIDRAIEGVDVPVYSYGKLIGSRRVFNDRLLMFSIKHGLGRLGTQDAAPLRPGTKAEETLAREDAEAKERWYEEYRDKLVASIRDEANALARIARMLRHCLLRAAECRADGDLAQEEMFGSVAINVIDELERDPGDWVMFGEMWGAMLDLDESLPAEKRAGAELERRHHEVRKQRYGDKA